MVNFLRCSPWSSSLSLSLLLLFVASFPFVTPLNFTFNFTGSDSIQIDGRLTLQGDTQYTPDGIQLTGNVTGMNVTWRFGRVLYGDRLRLWDGTSDNLLASFTTHFSFEINNNIPIVRSSPSLHWGDGLAFFLAPMSDIPITYNYSGGDFGLFNHSANRIVAAEFDRYQKEWPDYSFYHIGIVVDSIESASVDLVHFSRNTVHATVKYDGGSMNLSFLLSHSSEDPSGQSWNVSHVVDLRYYLPEEVAVGFSSSSSFGEAYTILYWDFNSNELPTAGSPAPAQDFNSTEPPTTVSPAPARNFNSTEPPNANIVKRHENRTRLLLVIGLGIVLCVLGLLLFVRWRRRKNQGRRGMAVATVVATAARLQTVFDQRRGPRSFAYQDLANATNNFAEEGKLGAGGFGAVYRGVIPNTENDLPVAIKKISRDSMQGEKEYMSEVILFSQLRHRNLVQLIGYCHEADDFLLVYEYMPNRSLDKHLYGGHRLLGWAERHKIALGLASALLYLHEEWEQCVVHRDIKPSNVMLDPNFNAKLGDFGLARLVDHDCTTVMTVLARTRGYIAPEYEKLGKARKESDVFSFGVVMLEMACGRKPINYAEEPEKINLVQWTWGLYEKDACSEAADRRLPCDELDERLMERLMVVGLWCAHPNYRLRPSIRRAIGVLNFEAPLSDLPLLNMRVQEFNDAAAASSSSSGPQSLNTISSSSFFIGR